MRRKKAIIELLSIVLVALLALAWTFHSGNKPLLGLDLQGGVSVVLTPKGQVDDDRIKQAISIMNQRINSLGVSEPDIHQEGNSIVVQIAGVKDRDAAIRLVNQTAELRFRPVMANLAPEPGVTDQTTGTTPGSTPGTTPGSTPGTAPASAPGTTPQSAPGAVAPNGNATTTAAPTTTAPATQQNGAGLAPGENAAGAAGWQAPSSTISDQTPTTAASPTTAAPTASTPTASTPTASTPTASTPGASQPTQQLTPEQLQQLQAQAGASGGGATTTPEQDAAPGAEKQTVILPQFNPKTHEQAQRYQLGPSGLTGSALSGATAGLDPQTGQWLVRPTFKPGAEGIDQFNAIAGKCYSKAAECPTGQLAITLDGRVISAPSINAPTFSADQIQISGSFDEDSAKALATALKYGALPVALEQQSTQDVSATLGQDSLTAGLVAGFVGLVLVTIYMIAFYRLLGVLAIFKLFVEGALLWSIISWLGSTAGLALTLAGVTGIIVSIGVSLDSNVVYYEHLREDVRKGRTVRSAVDKSFTSAIGTIWKADGASLLGAALLYWLAVGPVRGFAFFLAMSTGLDIISSYLYMRPVVFLATGSKLCREHPAWFGLPPESTAGLVPERSRPSRSKGKGSRPSRSSADDAATSDGGKRTGKDSGKDTGKDTAKETGRKVTAAGGDEPGGGVATKVDDDEIIDAVMDDGDGTGSTSGTKDGMNR